MFLQHYLQFVCLMRETVSSTHNAISWFCSFIRRFFCSPILKTGNFF